MFPLSFAQQRLWFLNRLDTEAWTYNLPLALRLEGPLDTAALRSALGDLVARHESLRTVFPEVDGEPWQQVRDTVDVAEFVTGLDVTAAELPTTLDRLARHAFDLTTDLPLRAWLLRTGERSHTLYMVLHHIVGDGWSMALLGRDLGAAYAARRAGGAPDWEPLPVQYADYALWQRELLEGPDGADLLAHWSGRLTGLPDELPLPLDRPRPDVSGDDGGEVRLDLPAGPARATSAARARRRRVAVHGRARGPRRPADPTGRRHRHSARHDGRGPRRRGPGGPDRVLREHVGAASGHERGPDVPGAARTGPRG